MKPTILKLDDLSMIIECIIFTSKQCKDPLIAGWYLELISKFKSEFKDSLPPDYEELTGIK